MGERLRGGRVLMVTSGGMYTQRLRDDDPEYLDGDYSPTTAYARSKRAQVELLPVLQHAGGRSASTSTPRTPVGRTPPASRTRCRPSARLTGPLLRDAAGGAETTVWLSATQPPPEGGRLWHDRRPRPTQILRRTRTGAAERARLWAWVTAQLPEIGG